MAVPFNMPEGQNEVEALLVQLQTLLNRLQMALRRNQQISQHQPSPTQASTSSALVPSTSGVRNTSNAASNARARRRNRSQSLPMSPATQNIVPDLLTNLSWLTTSATMSSSSTPLTTISVRSPRRRTISESSNSDEPKISITTIVKHDYYAQDLTKNNNAVGQGSSRPSEGLFSKITRGTMCSCSLMTAMICFVGWHIFRAR